MEGCKFSVISTSGMCLSNCLFLLQGVIHRDLKPSNIFMKSTIDICIGDFGVATVMGDARTKTRTMVGSMNWMAPEVRCLLSKQAFKFIEF